MILSPTTHNGFWGTNRILDTVITKILIHNRYGNSCKLTVQYWKIYPYKKAGVVGMERFGAWLFIPY